MKTITVEGTLRTDFGKSSNRRLRKEGYVPGVVYGGDENIHFYAKTEDFKDALYLPALCKIKLTVEGKEVEAIVKEAQYHPVSDDLLHLDLLELVAGVPVVTKIPIKMEGRAAGVQEGGVLISKVRKLQVRSLPEHLREFIIVDVSSLALNKSIKVKDLNKEKENLEILNPPNAPVASVVTPRALRSRSPMEALGVEREGDEEVGEVPTVSAEDLEGEEGEEGAEGEEGTEGAEEREGEKKEKAAE